MSSRSETLELSDYLAVLKRRRALLYCVSLPLLAITLALALGLPDIFVSTGLIRHSGAPVSGDLAQGPAARQKVFIDAYMLGLANAVLSPPVLQQLLQKMPSLIAPGETPAQACLDIIDHTRVRPVKMAILDPDTSRSRKVIFAFAISFDASNPATAQAVASWLTQAFIGGNRIGLQARAAAAEEFYRLVSERYRARISQLESQLADFKALHFEQLPQRAAFNLAELERDQRELDSVNQQLRTLAENRIFLEAQLTSARAAVLNRGMLAQWQAEYARQSARLDADHPDMLSLRVQIDRMRSTGQSLDALSTRAQLQMNQELLGLLRQRYSDDHPDVKRLQRQIAGLEARARTEIRTEVRDHTATVGKADTSVDQLATELNALDTQTDQLRQAATGLREQLAGLEQRLKQSPLIEHEYKTLSADLDSVRARYEALSRNAMSIEVTRAAIASGRSDDLRIVQEPELPNEPAKPRRLLICGIGTLLAAIVGISAVIVRENLDQKVRSSRDIYQLLETWPVVAIPLMHDGARARRHMWQVGLLMSTTALASVAAVVTGRMLFT